jgi:hypothetical protein
VENFRAIAKTGGGASRAHKSIDNVLAELRQEAGHCRPGVQKMIRLEVPAVEPEVRPWAQTLKPPFIEVRKKSSHVIDRQSAGRELGARARRTTETSLGLFVSSSLDLIRRARLIIGSVM